MNGLLGVVFCEKKRNAIQVSVKPFKNKLFKVGLSASKKIVLFASLKAL